MIAIACMILHAVSLSIFSFASLRWHQTKYQLGNSTPSTMIVLGWSTAKGILEFAFSEFTLVSSHIKFD